MTEKYIQFITTRDGGDTADMVAVLVGYQDGVQIPGRKTNAGQASRQIAWAEAAVDQDAGTARLDHQGIATTAATERGEAHTESPSAI